VAACEINPVSAIHTGLERVEEMCLHCIYRCLRKVLPPKKSVLSLKNDAGGDLECPWAPGLEIPSSLERPAIVAEVEQLAVVSPSGGAT
jgi:hypothetical protein